MPASLPIYIRQKADAGMKQFSNKKGMANRYLLAMPFCLSTNQLQGSIFTVLFGIIE
jgi:hypothetical protein